MSRVGGEVFSLTRSFSSRHLSNATLPTIQAAVGHIPQKLKTNGIEPNRRARLEVLRKIVTRLVREERAELQWNRAVEARPYLERLIQLAVEKGPSDEYTNEMVEWWLPEPGLDYKLYEVIAPRFVDRPAPFTGLYRLPSKRLEQYIQNKRIFWKRYEIGVLEIEGNPFPAVVSPPHTNNSHLLLNQLLKKSLQSRLNTLEKKE
ncbi:mrpl-17 [Pristionchus pacificus]|uniref:Large ribosomal subunit protein bL17m n=1 Tax=Pristionchus pacificus TaxID=54126 RepID=A0A2A6BJ19_PRIPA|nr:mrpl-17 [Pristionchus pacificus]|eukprot:PDM65904.1 mrpl-17 [Pristionchus pacificus]